MPRDAATDAAKKPDGGQSLRVDFESDERARPARVLSWSEGVIVYDDAEAGELAEQLRKHWPEAG